MKIDQMVLNENIKSFLVYIASFGPSLILIYLAL